MAGDVAIKVDGVNKSFILPHEKTSSIKGALVNYFHGKSSFEHQKVLKNISFEIKKGEFFGIVGRNGSGKSTLLKILAGIYQPNAGHIQVNGKLVPFIELGVGFNPELTGRENVFLNGALLGFNRKEMNAMYQDIVDFAEIERFMDQKLKNYSSGMQIRLAFSIAIRARTEILLIDEVLAVGDLDFQRKCYEYFMKLKSESQTVVFVTHDMSAVRKFCDTCVLIDKGQVKEVGKPDKIAAKYESINLRSAEIRLGTEEKQELAKTKKREGMREAEIETVRTFNSLTGETQKTFSANEKIGVEIIFEAHEKLKDPTVGFIFQDEADLTIFATNNNIMKLMTKSVNKDEKIVLRTIVDNVFTNGKYTISCAIENKEITKIYDRIEYIYSFIIGGHPLGHAKTHPAHKMSINTETT